MVQAEGVRAREVLPISHSQSVSKCVAPNCSTSNIFFGVWPWPLKVPAGFGREQQFGQASVAAVPHRHALRHAGQQIILWAPVGHCGSRPMTRCRLHLRNPDIPCRANMRSTAAGDSVHTGPIAGPVTAPGGRRAALRSGHPRPVVPWIGSVRVTAPVTHPLAVFRSGIRSRPPHQGTATDGDDVLPRPPRGHPRRDGPGMPIRSLTGLYAIQHRTFRQRAEKVHEKEVIARSGVA